MAKASSRYWADRFEDLKRAEMQTSESYVKDLNEAFDKASAQVEKDLAAWYQRLADNNGVSLTKAKQMLDSKALKEFHWDVEEYQKRMMEDGKNHIWMKELENASAKTHISWLEAEKLRLQQSAEELYAKHAADTKSFLGKTYQDGYLHSAYEIQHGIGAGSPFRIPDTKTIDKVLSKPWAPDGKNFSDRIWKEKDKLVGELHTNLTQMVTRGESPDRAIKAMADRFNVSRSKAGRLVSTEAAFFSSASRGDCFSELGVERYQIVATLDADTCAECGDLDGTVYKESEREPGVTAPPFHPNCHCSDAPYFDDEFTKNERRAARDKDGNYYTVPSSMKYPEWKAKYGEGTGLAANGDGVRTSRVPEKPPEPVEKIDFADKTVVESTLEKYEAEFVDSDVEHAAVVAPDGDVYHLNDEKAGSVDPRGLGAALAGSHITHNHPPAETQYSFSDSDMDIFLNYGVQELSGVDHKYKYRVKRTAKTKKPKVGDINHKFTGEYRNEAYEAGIRGEIDIDEDEYDFIVRKLAEEYRFEYIREKR